MPLDSREVPHLISMRYQVPSELALPTSNVPPFNVTGEVKLLAPEINNVPLLLPDVPLIVKPVAVPCILPILNVSLATFKLAVPVIINGSAIEGVGAGTCADIS